jgi:FkbM family methyltransferase
MILQQLELLDAYVRSDGYARGAGSFVRTVAALRRRAPAARIRLPGPRTDVWLRPRTSDYATLRACWLEGAYDAPFSQRFRASDTFEDVARRGRPLTVDLGAHIGLASLRIASQYPGIQVVAVEPAPRNVALLRRNLASLPDAVVVAGAIWHSDGEVRLTTPDNDFSQDGYGTTDAAGPPAVRAFGLESVIGACPGAVPFFLKVDVEGAEAQIFQNESAWQFPIIAIESHEWLHPGEHRLSRFLEGHMTRNRDLLVGRGGVLFSVEQ